MINFPAGLRKHLKFSPHFRIGLKTQIALLGIIGVLFMGAVCLVGLNYVAGAQLESDQSVKLRQHLVGLSANYLEAGQIANEFLRKHAEKLIDKHAVVMETALGHLSEIETFVDKLPEGNPLKQTSALRSGLNLYQTRFQNLTSIQRVLGLNENQGLQGKLGSAVHEVESKLAELDQPRLSILMLMMRRHEKDFMLRGDEKYGDDFSKRQSEFAAALAASGLPDKVRDQLSALMKTYKESFVAYAVTQSTLNDEVDDFATVFQRNRPSLDALVKAADDRYRSSEARATELRQSLLWVIAAATACTGLFAMFFGQRIANSIARMTDAMQKLASGDFSIVLPGLGRSDEVGDMAQAVETFKIKAKQKAHEAADAKAEQELIAAAARKADMRSLADEFEGAVGRMVETVSAASAELEAAAGSLTAASEEASTNVQSVAVATEQMSSSVNEISRQVQDSARIASEAVQQAQRTNDRVGELSMAAGRIGDVVKLINAIAGQTNLLALNATIEAARAGDAGRGFAVVASEVKALAAQTAKATAEISQQISGIQTATRESAMEIETISGTIGRMSEIASTIASAVEEQGAATQEISRNVQQAAQGTLNVGSNIMDVQQGADEIGSASSKVFSAAKSLSGESHRLKADVATFLNSVRTA